MTPEFQKLNKTDNCIVIYLKNDARVAVTSQVWYISSHRYDISRLIGNMLRVNYSVRISPFTFGLPGPFNRVTTTRGNLGNLLEFCKSSWEVGNFIISVLFIFCIDNLSAWLVTHQWNLLIVALKHRYFNSVLSHKIQTKIEIWWKFWTEIARIDDSGRMKNDILDITLILCVVIVT